MLGKSTAGTLSACLAGLFMLGLTGCGVGTSSASSDVAATVNGHAVAMADYQQSLNVTRSQQTGQVGYDACAVKGMQMVCKSWKQQALKTLIDNELVREYARQHHIVVTKAQYAANWQAVYKKNFQGSKRILNAFLKSNHETAGYLRQSTDADLLRSKVLYPITKNMSAYAPAVALGLIAVHTKVELKTAEGLLKQNFSFQKVIQELNAQPNACIQDGCTELGWVPYPFLPQGLGQAGINALKTQKIGSVVGPVVHQQDWELYKIWNRTPHFHMNNDQQYQRRTQLFYQWLGRQEKAAQIKRYVAV